MGPPRRPSSPSSSPSNALSSAAPLLGSNRESSDVEVDDDDYSYRDDDRLIASQPPTQIKSRPSAASSIMTVIARTLRSIVRNDAMKSDPDEVYGWQIFAPVFAACFGGMVFGWDTGAISGVLAMPATKEKFGYADWDKKDISLMEQNIVSTLQAGCFLACFFTGWLTDRFGRRPCLIGTGLLTATGIMMQAASAAHGTIAVMYVGRFLAGMGVGAASTLTPLYVSECAPPAIRGALTSTLQSCFGCCYTR
jgi:hypothetical protein